jgi:threonine dehydratase
MTALTLTDVQEAAERIAPHIRHTPLQASPDLSALAGRTLLLKLENLQRTGAFKIRGALNKLLTMDPADAARGVLTASAGNHGQGVALAARLLGYPATIVLPLGVSLAKLEAIERQSAQTVLHGTTYDEAARYAHDLAEERGMTYIHAFDDPLVIAGQGTIALEMLADAPDLDTLVVPVGGGGLIAGIATAARALKPSLTIIGVQAAGAPACVDSFKRGTRQTLPVSTIADGIAVAQPGASTFPIIHALVDEMVTVDDDAMARAMVLLLEREKLLAEAAGAAGLAAALGGALPEASRNVGVLISGGNVDPNLLDKCIQTGLASAGRFLAFQTWLPDQPGALHRLTGVLTEERVNILHVAIQRIGPYTAIGPVGLEMIVETRNTDHAARVLDAVRAAGYPVAVVTTRASEGPGSPPSASVSP